MESKKTGSAPKRTLFPTRKFNHTRRKNKYTPDTQDRCIQFVRKTGSELEMRKALGIPKATLSTWKKRHPEFANALARARGDFEKYIHRNITGLRLTALHSMEELLSPKECTKIIHTRKKLFDEETGKELSVVEDKTQTITYTREADWRALIKVLGEKELLYFILEKQAEGNRRGEVDVSLFDEIFGKEYSNIPVIKENENLRKYFLSDSIDMVRMRMLQIETQRAYDNREISLEEYNQMTTQQSQTYSAMRNNAEIRAQRILGNRSYQDIMHQLQIMMQEFINLVHEVAIDESIERHNISNEVTTRIRSGGDRLGGLTKVVSETDDRTAFGSGDHISAGKE